MRPKRISELMGRGNIEENVVTIIDRLMAFRHQQYSEIMQMPIPLVNQIMKQIDKQIERENKAMKGKK